MKRLLLILGLLFCAFPSFAQTQIGTCNAQSSGSSVTTGNCTVTAGQSLIIGVGTSGAGTTVSSVTISNGDATTNDVTRLFLAGAAGWEVWSRCSLSTTGTVTVTV